MEEAGEPWCSGRGPPTNPGAEEPTSSLQTYTWITELNLLNKFGHLNVQRSNCRTNRHTVFPDLNWRRRHRKRKALVSHRDTKYGGVSAACTFGSGVFPLTDGRHGVLIQLRSLRRTRGRHYITSLSSPTPPPETDS